MPRDGSANSGTTRRRWLGLMGGGSAAFLAGCSGDSPEESNDNGTAQDDSSGPVETPSMTDQVFQTTTWANPKSVQFNRYNGKQASTNAYPFLFGSLARYSQSNGEWIPHLAEDWSVSGTSLTLTLNGDYVWHNGDPVTSQDVKTKLLTERVMEGTVASLISSVDTPDDTTVEIGLSGEVNKELLYQNLLTLWIDTPHSVYQDFVSDVEYGSPDKTYESAQQELVGYRWEDPIGWGPFELNQRTGQVIELTKFKDHPAAEKVNFPKITFRSIEDNQQKMQGYLSKRYSGGLMIPTESVQDQMPDSYRRYPYSRGLGLSISFNHQVEEFQDRRVRQALSHALDREGMISNMSVLGKKALPFDTGFFGEESLQKEYLGDDLSSFTRYDGGAERATTLLEDAGFTKSDGQWLKPNGNRFSITLTAPSGFPAWRVALNTATDQLGDFGIETEFKPKEVSNYLSQTLPKGDYEIAATFIGNRILHPLPALESTFYGSPITPTKTNFPDEVSVPMPIGDTSGSEETVNVRQLVDEIGSSSGAEAKEKIKKLSWTFNQAAPSYIAFSSQNWGYLNTEKWSAPKDSPLTNVQLPISSLLHKGNLQAK